MSDGLECCPEWCELGAEPHDEVCPGHKVSMTKAEFVAAAEGGAKAAVEDFLFWIEDEGLPRGEAIEMVVEQASEGAVCFIGIGSCGRGWCKHS